MRPTRLLTLLTILLWSISAFAGIDPMDARGFALDKIYDFHSLDAINTFNGNLNISVPIGGEYTVGDGLKYRVKLTYNSTIWDQEDITPIGMGVPNYVDPMQNLGPDTTRMESVPVRWNNAGLGWNLTFGELRRGESRVEWFRYSYVSPDGATHFLYDGLHGPEGNASNPTVGYSRDGTYIRMRIPSGAANDRIIETADGVRHYFRCIEGCGTGAPVFQLESMIDARSNGLYICAPVPAATATSKTWTLREVVGANRTARVDPCSTTAFAPVREHVVTFQKSVLKMHPDANWNRWRVSTVALSAFNGTATYTFNYQPGARVLREASQNIDWKVYDQNKSLIQWNGDFTIDVDLLASVTSPAGTNTNWQFGYYGNFDSAVDALGDKYQCSTIPDGSACTTAYDEDPGDHPWNEIAGRLKTLTLPTQGTIEYAYQRWGYPRRTCEPPDYSPGPNVKARGPQGYNMGVRQRKADGGTTYYAGYARDPFGSATDPCDGARDFVGTTIDPLGNATLAYYSISHQDVDGWKREEYGLPFTRKPPPYTAQLPAGTTANFFLSQETYQCGAGYIGGGLLNSQIVTKMKEILSAGSCGAVQRSTWVKYEHSFVLCSGDYSGPDCLQSNRRVKSERVLHHDDLDAGVFVYADTLHDKFDGHGNYRETKIDGSFDDANFGQGANDAVVTFRNYNPGRSETNLVGDLWLLSLFDEERITNNAGALKAQTLFQHDGTGFLTGKRTLFEGSLAPTGRLKGNDLLLKQERAVAGNEITIRERYYGGDGGGLSTSDTAPFSSGSSPEQYRIDRTFLGGAEKYAAYIDGVGNDVHTISSSDIHLGSGLVQSTYDSPDPSASDPYRLGAKTDYVYDLVGRLKEVRPQAPQTQSSISYDYTVLGDGVRVEIKRPANNGSLYHAFVELDGYGRRRAERRKMPDGWFSERTFSYLANGWKLKESTANKEESPNNTNDEPQYFTSYGQYDAFGRPGTITLPDGRTAVLDYSGTRVVKRTEKVQIEGSMNDVITWEHSDRRGNLVKVVQSTRDGLGDLVAKYTFDESNRLTDVSQGSQSRKFLYDKRGLLHTEKHPELSADVVYQSFDARGHHSVRKYFGLADNELHYTYDRAERTTDLRVKKGSGYRQVKKFQFHASNRDECGNDGFMRGKLERATRHNWVRDPVLTGNEININVADYFSYDNDGNVRAKTLNVARTDASDPLDLRFETIYSYDFLGNVRGIIYPGCSGCTGISGTPARTVTYTIGQGRVTALPGFVTDIDYHPNGMMAEVVHRAGGGAEVRDFITVADHGMARPKRMYTAGATDGLGNDADWNPNVTDGVYDYDGVGNIRQIGIDTFTYDGGGRITTACIGGRKQKFEYDEYGNAKRILTYTACSGSTVLKDQVNTVLGHTNRLSGAQYDSFGNLTAQSSEAYSYDPLNMMTWARTVITNPSRPDLGKVFLYDASDERVAVVDYRMPPADPTNASAPWRIRWQWTIRGLDNKVLREYERVQDAGAAPLPYRWTDDYIYAGDRLMTAVNVTTGLRHQHTDHLGTPRLLTDSNGVAVASHKYYPFGEEMTLPDTDPSRMRFTGHERDNNNIIPNSQDGDLDYMHARYYSPLQGRFWSVDPVGGTRTETQSWNRYTYVKNNPLRFRDPDGRQTRQEDPALAQRPNFFNPAPKDVKYFTAATEVFDTANDTVTAGLVLAVAAEAPPVILWTAFGSGVGSELKDTTPKTPGQHVASVASMTATGAAAGRIAAPLKDSGSKLGVFVAGVTSGFGKMSGGDNKVVTAFGQAIDTLIDATREYGGAFIESMQQPVGEGNFVEMFRRYAEENPNK